ncbi:MAG: hypothetical protein ACREDR_28985 [Blastocatellia bacterium]
MPADELDYEGVPYGDLVFEDIDWSEIGEHDPARRSERKGTSERDVATEWATEACQDERRWVRSAGSKSGLTGQSDRVLAHGGLRRDSHSGTKGSSTENPVVGCHGLGSQAV